MTTKDESSVDVDFAVCSYKKEGFYFISRGIFSLYNVLKMRRWKRENNRDEEDGIQE